ncbi:MAG: class I SAM-dependent methyltransferase [Bryobacteraceae bacterium]
MKRFEGTISRDYEFVPQSVPKYYELQDLLARRIASQYAAPIVVDIGSGTGITTAAILSRSPNAVVKGVDSESTMLDQARSRLRPELATGRVELHHCDALEFLSSQSDASADVVASSYTFHNCFRTYRAQMEVQIVRILKPGGMFINNDKYAADDRDEYVRELAEQIIRYDVLRDVGREDLRQIWIRHEIEDQIPERIMWTLESLEALRLAGFVGASLIERIGQYAVMTAFKP